MAGALAADRDLVGKVGLEENQRLRIEPAVLGEAEAQGVDPGPPCYVGGALARRGEGIGEARPVHVQSETALPGELAKRGNLGGSIDKAIFGRVGDRERGRLDLVDVVADCIASGAHRLGRYLCAWAVQKHQLGAAGEEARCPGLIDLDMRIPMAEDRAIGWAQGRERETICCGTGRHPEGANLGFKHL
jgi:hypothetical protein